MIMSNAFDPTDVWCAVLFGEYHVTTHDALLWSDHLRWGFAPADHGANSYELLTAGSFKHFHHTTYWQLLYAGTYR